MGTTRGAGFMLAGLIASFAAWSAWAEDQLPRYRLEPGMELSYKGSDTFKHQSGMHLSDHEMTAWVIRRNVDGSVRVVLRQGNRFRQTRAADTLKNLFKKQDQPPMDYQFGYFDLLPDGRIGPESELGYQIDPATLFPRLPDNDKQGKALWEHHEDKIAKEYQYSALQAEPGGWAFHSDRIGPEKKIYGMNVESTFHFDNARGAIRRIDQAYTQDYGFKGKGTGSVELTGVEKKDAAWLAAFAPAVDRYFAANKVYERAVEDASKDAAQANKILADAKTALKSARDAVDQSVFRDQLDRQISKHDSMASYYADSAKRRGDVIDKLAADWSLQGLDGKTHSLADYHGKVLVLDFWYRGCGWCIKAMPQMNALAEQFGGRPVAVLGMNTDSDEADAKHVIDVMELKYGTLRAKGIPEKYGVQGFPTLIIIDREGMVRDIHVGYSPTLRADVAKVIEGLLAAESKVTAKP